MPFSKWMLVFFLLLAVFVAAPQSAIGQIQIGSDLSAFDYSKPQEYEIGGITVEGIKYLDNNVLIMLSGLTVGEKVRVPGDNITDAIRKLWDQGLFEDVAIYATEIVGNKIFLEIQLKERPRVSKFSFEGIRKGEADDIRSKINLTRGDVATDHLYMRTKILSKTTFMKKVFWIPKWLLSSVLMNPAKITWTCL